MPIHNHSRLAALLLGAFGVLATPVQAQEVMGLQVTATPSEAQAQEISLDALDAMDQVSFETTTIWTDGVQTFSGVPLKAVLDAAGADGEAVELVALNDYAIKVPMTELTEDAPIVATRMNGEIMSVRDKGPYWVVYPYDQNAEYQTETIYSRSIWQLNRIKVVD